MSFLKSIFGGGGKAKTELFTPPPPPSDEAIAEAELALNIKFPQSFISFMRESRPMRLPICARFNWIGTVGQSAGNIIAANSQEHVGASSPLPHFLVAFYNDGMGNQVCFDTRSGSENGEYSIVFWDHELGSDENLEAVQRQSTHHERAGIIAFTFPDWLKIACVIPT